MKEEIQKRILESAEVLFASKGYKNTTIANIAKAAGVSVGNVYRYYISKEEILYKVLPAEFVELIQNIMHAKILSGKSETIAEQMQK